MLRELDIRHSYRSDEHDLINEFYIPCLSVSTSYQRAVGFFSSSALSSAAKGLHAFVSGGGRMQLIASPHLSAADIEEINEGYAARELVEERAVLRAFESVMDEVEQNRLGLLGWLIQYDRLDVKVAVLQDTAQLGIYHEKLGVFSDGQDFIAFTGSSNESESGLVSNFECIDVYCSWKIEDRVRAEEKRLNFAKLWADQTNRLRVYPFPEAARQSLLQFRQGTAPPTRDPEQKAEGVSTISGCPRVPQSIELRPYQNQAISNWMRNNGRGTFKMATGSGKTITALATAAKLYELIGLKALIVICPYRHLVNQWARECELFGLNPIRCYENRREWQPLLSGGLYSVSAGQQDFITVLTTNATFGSEGFQSLLPYFPPKTLLVGDEAHNLGARHILSALPDSVRFRLALSATPERWFDDEGTEGIYDYFGSVLEPEFTLRDALENHALVPYFYYPVFVELTDEESEQYSELSRKIGRAMAMKRSGGDDSQALSILLNRRSRLIGAAQNKLVALREIISDRLDTSHTLFYCGDGSVEEPASGETMRQLDAVSRLLGHELNYRVDVYTADTTLDEREDLRSRFISGELQGLVAIRCLDEGVDIPLTKTAFLLASSTNPRQFIQRRGRVLRPHPQKKSADIFDFIVVPPRGSGNVDQEVERSLLRRELSRYLEFADLAQNSGQVRGLLVELQQRLGLLSM